MSHFTVMVIGADFEKQLAPYQENNMGDCPKEYLAFNDREEEALPEYESGSTKRVVMPDGRLLAPWDEIFRVPGSFGTGSGTHVVPDHLKQREVPFKELFSTFDEYMSSWCGYERRDPETNRYGYWDNPNKKWDWYQVGGRWSGLLKLKHGETGTRGKPGVMGSVFKEGTDRADVAKKCEIDFEGMRREAAEEAAEDYDNVAAVKNGSWITWEECVEKFNKNYSEARDFYHAQSALKALKEALKDDHPFRELDQYLVTREVFIQRASDRACSTYAVVKDGKWYARGEMGWWGVSLNESDAAEWNSKVRELLDELPGDTLITIVDCHI